ncbi:MAG: hypothetical protein ACI4WM_09290 [Erysipelotrichaceae bacterium]
MAASSEALKRAKKKWESEKVEQLTVRVKKGKRQVIADCAAKNHESVNRMLNRLIDEELKKSGMAE